MSDLDDLRQKIDEIDQALMRLIDQRAGLAHDIAKVKAATLAKIEGAGLHQNHAPQLFHPDREAIVLRKLLNQTTPLAARPARLSIWRALIAESLRIQGESLGVMRTVYSRRDPSSLIETLMSVRFGHEKSIIPLADEKEVIMACQEVNTLGVLSLDPQGGAWWARLLANPRVKIVAGLPELAQGWPKALVIAGLRPEPSGDDLTFWVTDAQLSTFEISRQLSLAGFAADLIAQSQGFKLFGLQGFVQDDDKRLLEASGDLKGMIGSLARLN